MLKLSELPDIVASDLWNIPGLPGPQGESIVGPQGLKGDKGDAGRDGSGFVWCGQWSRTATYGVNDVVGLDGSSYVCTSPSHNNRPHSTSRIWQLLAARGERGSRGDDGISVRGPRGRQGEPGTSADGSDPIAFIADTEIAAGQPLRVTTAGHCTLADATALATATVVALATTNVGNGVAGIMQAGDTLTLDDWTAVVGSSTLTPGFAYYLSETTGMLSTDGPLPADGVCVVYVGRALSAGELLIEIGNPVVLTEPPEDE